MVSVVGAGLQKVRVGSTFGLLTVTGPAEYVWQGKKRRYIIPCRCRCGIEKKINKNNVVRGKTLSCGCLQRATSSGPIVHGETGTYLWNCWDSMMKRCLREWHKQYHNYGGRGITVHPPWREYVGFRRYVLRYLGERPSPEHSLDRIDNDDSYVPGNIRWATRREQNSNTRSNTWLTFKGEKLTLGQWAEKLDINSTALGERLKRGWSVEKTLTTPLRNKRELD